MHSLHLNSAQVPRSNLIRQPQTLQGYLAHKKLRPPLGLPQGPRHSPTVGSYGGAISYERSTPVPPQDPLRQQESLFVTRPP